MSNKRSRNRILSRLAAIGVIGAGGFATGVAPVMAQDSDESSLMFEEIIVTAQKREQSLTEVPVAVSVVNSEAIDNSFAANIESLHTLVPSVSFRKGTTSANSALTVRGIGTISFSGAAEPSVSTVVDGVVLGRSGQAFSALYDIERIEVLRGPQGTLFGKNASAGVLNIVTKRPTDEFEGYVDLTFAEDNEWQVRGKLSGPLGDNVRGSLVAMKSEFGGHIRNVFSNRDVNGYSREGIRAMVEFDPADDLSVLAILEYNKSNDDCCADLEVLPSGRNPDSRAAPDSAGIVNGITDLDLNQRQVDHDFETFMIDETVAGSVEVNKDMNGFTLTSITAFRRWENTEFREGDFTSIGGSSTTPVFAVPFLLHDDGTREWDQFSQEFRLSSPDGERLFYQIGGYFFDLHQEADFTRAASCQNNGGQNQAILDANPGLTCGANDIVSATGFSTVDIRNWAIFGQADYEVTDHLSVILGARFTDDFVKFEHRRVNNDPFGRQGVGVRPDRPNSQFSRESGGFARGFGNGSNNSDFSFKAGLSYDLEENGSVYATYAQGYKGPAFNVFYNMGRNDELPIDQESSDSFEVGYKYASAQFLLNIAAYYTEISGFQANNFDNSTGVTITRLTNAGDVSTKGIEMDFQWNATEDLFFTGALSLNDAQIEEFNCPVDPLTGNPPAGCSTRSGLDLLFSPDVNWTLSGNYRTIVNGDDSVLFNVTWARVDEQNSLLPGTNGTFNPVSRLPGYDKVDVSLGYEFGDGQYKITAFVKNLFDKSFVTTYSGDGFRYQIPRDADRYFGVNLRANFR